MNENVAHVSLGGGSLLLVASRNNDVMMSYIIDTPCGDVIVIDGGAYTKEDAQCLYEMLQSRGKHVGLWFVTHGHDDHFGALLYLMEKRSDFDITIDKICFNFPPLKWFETVEDGMNYGAVSSFLNQIKQKNIPAVKINGGDVFETGGMSIEVLNDPYFPDGCTSVNATSVVLLAHFPKKDVLFLADMNEKGEKHLLKQCGISKLRKDIVQMAHHGQEGVSKEFYEIIQPKICLYNAPKWLWENNYLCCSDPKTAGKGIFKTLETRKWMEEIGSMISCVMMDGDYLLI